MTIKQHLIQKDAHIQLVGEMRTNVRGLDAEIDATRQKLAKLIADRTKLLDIGFGRLLLSTEIRLARETDTVVLDCTYIDGCKTVFLVELEHGEEIEASDVVSHIADPAFKPEEDVNALFCIKCEVECEQYELDDEGCCALCNSDDDPEDPDGDEDDDFHDGDDDDETVGVNEIDAKLDDDPPENVSESTLLERLGNSEAWRRLRPAGMALGMEPISAVLARARATMANRERRDLDATGRRGPPSLPVVVTPAGIIRPKSGRAVA